MNVASLELCRELYELSGWGYNETDKVWCHGKLKNEGLIDTREVHEHFPAFDLGYLLRKLPQAKLTGLNPGWSIQNALYGNSYVADTPEDAAAKLAIELFKQGVLK